MKRVKADDLHREWMRKPSYRCRYEALEKEYALLSALMQTRADADSIQTRLERCVKAKSRRLGSVKRSG
jgi:hypothetical protein